MARFKAQIEGAGGVSASRLGSTVATAITGWESGVEVRAEVKDNADVFHIYATGGAKNSLLTRIFLGTVYLDDAGEVRFKVNNQAFLKEEDR